VFHGSLLGAFLKAFESDVVEELHGSLSHLLRTFAGDNDDSLPVRHHHVAGSNQDPAAGDGTIYRFQLVSSRSDSPAESFVVNRNLLRDDLVGVSDSTAGDDSNRSLALPGLDIAGSDRS